MPESHNSGDAAAMEQQRDRAPEYAKALRWILILYMASAVGVGLQRTLISPENNSLILRAASRHLLGSQDLYIAYPALHADYFKYSPTFALLFVPFAMLPMVLSYIAWAVTSALTVYIGITRAMPGRAAVIALLLAWLAAVGDFQRSQTNVLCAGLMILAWSSFERGSDWKAAIAIVLGTFIKIFPAVAVTFALFRPRWIRFALIFTAVFLVAAALPLIAVPWSSLAMQYKSWLNIEAHDALPLGRYGTGGADLYAGLMGQFRVWWGVEWPHWPTQLAGVLILLTPVALRRNEWKSRHFRVLYLASVLVFCVLFNHQAESPSYSIAIIGAAIWFAESERAWWRIVMIAVAIAIVNLGSTDLMPRAWYHGWYVKYLVKTLPLIPLWIAMQAELLGIVANRAPSERGEINQREIPTA